MPHTNAELEDMAREVYKHIPAGLDVNERGILLAFLMEQNSEELLDTCADPEGY